LLNDRNLNPICKEHEVVLRVLDIARDAKQSGVREIFISGLYNIKSISNERVYIYNMFLKEKCFELGYVYVCHSNITISDLYDGLHVNNSHGNDKLRNNILQCFDTFKYDRLSHHYY
jgi:hypothetical protein